MAKRSTKQKMNLAQKIIAAHLKDGQMIPGEEITMGIDQTITQDSTGPLTYLQLEAIGVQKVKTQTSVSYVDHNMLQLTYETTDDHRFLQSVAAKMGVHFSRPGNGICHKVHLERFGIPGDTLLGSHSHCTTLGALGMLGIAAGGLEVALAMAGEPLRIEMPKVARIVLKGAPASWIGAKDIALEILRRLTVRGGTGKILEFTGDGLKRLPVSERAIIANMCAETGATAALFPSDAITRTYLKRERRLKAFKTLEADKGASYDEEMEIDLRKLRPLVAQPFSPDNVIEATKLKDVNITQVCIGGTSNSTYRNLMQVAALLDGKKVHPEVNLTITPGSRQVLMNITKNGGLHTLLKAGARILEPAYGPSAGMGQAPESGGVSLRTFSRNYRLGGAGRDSEIYLSGPAVATLSAIAGKIVCPVASRKRPPVVRLPDQFEIDDSQILAPAKSPSKAPVWRGPNIKPVPMKDSLPQDLAGSVLFRVGDNVTTDDILPTTPRALAFRSNIPKLADYVFSSMDPSFVRRTRSVGGGFIVAGENYGHGSAREHAALAPMYLGVRAVIAKSFARIHRQNLINCGILPLKLKDDSAYEDISQGDTIEIPFVRIFLDDEKPLVVKNTRSHRNYNVEHNLTRRQVEIILAGGLLNLTRTAQGLETPASKARGRRNT